jgi:signal transduction histidine kinase
MSLRSKLIALSLLTLLLPWSGWKLLQELESFLREAQENALLASARTLAGSLPLQYQTSLLFAPDLSSPLRSLSRAPILDGYADDWPDAGHGLEFASDDSRLGVLLLAGNHGGQLYLFFDVRDAEAGSESEIVLQARNPRGLLQFRIRPEAPGPLQLHSDGEGAGQLEGFWLDSANGYRVELAVPAATASPDISFTVTASGGSRSAGPGGNGGRGTWISLVAEWTGLSQWLAASAPDATRAWLVDDEGWVLADSGSPTPSAAQTTWLQRLLYRLVAGRRTAVQGEWADAPVRLDNGIITRALAGEDSLAWSQDSDTALVRNTAAVPLELDGRPRAAVVLQSASEGLLLVTNRALGRLLLTTLAISFGLAGGLWLFATRLSRRVRRLSGAVSHAMEDGARPGALPLTRDGDELGELARNNEKLLRAVSDYNQYLQTLAGKLSHELKTPLAITRSSLDNLSSQELDRESRRFLLRAREGLDRQAAIVRAMSEASRLEAAIGVAEWEEIDLATLLRRCVEGYRSIHPGRRLALEAGDSPASLYCAPDLLAQALDKLVDNALSLISGDDTVTLVLEQDESAYRLIVRNSGSRLPEELRDRLFDSLVSLRDRRGSAPHLGLGLYIVRLVALAHNGSVEARNLAGDAGVEFVISLPFSNRP